MARRKVQSEEQASYSNESEEAQVLAAAESILSKRLERVGKISDPSEASSLLRMRLAGLAYEVFSCIFLDTRHRILAVEDLFRGTIDGAEVHPREVARRCLALNAAAVIFSHNHPSGSTEPSAADRAITARLKQSLALLEIRVLDHIIVSAEGTTSMAQRGLL